MGRGLIELDAGQVTRISRALADANRFRMLEQIAGSREAPTCTCVCESLGLAPATVSHHLRELESAGLVEVAREGKFARITLRRDVWKAYLKRLAAL